MEASLAAIQLGITFTSALAAATGGAGVVETFAPYLEAHYGLSKIAAQIIAVVFLIIPLSLLTIIFAELIPKMFALRHKEYVVLKLSPWMKLFTDFFYPVVSLLERIVKFFMLAGSRAWAPKDVTSPKQSLSELQAAVSIARSARLMGAYEEKIVLSAAQLSLRTARSILIPAQEICMIWVESSIMDAFIKAHLDMHTRFPVCTKDGDPQTIIGYVNFKDIMVALKMTQHAPLLRGIVRPLPKVLPDVKLSSLLQQMVQERIHIALVADSGSVYGMITMEDIMEELLGDIQDEFDRLPMHVHAYGNGVIAGGGVPVTTVASHLGLDWSARFTGQRVPTFAEWCQQKAGDSCRGGDPVDIDGICIVPRKFRRKMLAEAVITRIPGKTS
jgi:putative hemolysin